MLAIIQLLNKLWGLFDSVMNAIYLWQRNRALARNEKRAEALGDLKKAQTDEEIWDAQDRVVDNRPEP